MSTSRRWFITLLATVILSITINLLLVGWIAGTRIGEPQRIGRGALQQFSRSMPDELRGELRRELRARARPLAQHLRAARQARREVTGLLQQAELDRPQIEARFAQAREHTAAVQRLLQETILEVAVKADVETRRRWLAQQRPADGDLGTLLSEVPARAPEPVP